jgi:hypothetical protein
LEIDHIFVFIDKDGPEIAALTGLGLVETYRRQHIGQGTANVCFAFDNLFLELLWMDDPAAALSPAIVRTGLEARARWRSAGTCPFGIAWRGEPKEAIETWRFAPPYLPEGITIDVAVDSDDPRQPMMFSFPGSRAPTTWDAQRQGNLQHEAGFQRVSEILLTLPKDVTLSPTLRQIAAQASPNLIVQSGPVYGLQVLIEGPNQQARSKLR